MSLSKPKGRLLAVDYGQARIGLAISDDTRVIANSLGVIKGHKEVKKSVNSLLERLRILKKDEYVIGGIIVGYPLHMDGKPGTLAKEIQEFAKAVEEATEIPVTLWEERLTSMQADRILQEAFSLAKSVLAPSTL